VNVVSKEVHVVVGVSGYRRFNVTVEGDFQTRHCVNVGFQDIDGVVAFNCSVLVDLAVDETRGVNHVVGYAVGGDNDVEDQPVEIVGIVDTSPVTVYPVAGGDSDVLNMHTHVPILLILVYIPSLIHSTISSTTG